MTYATSISPDWLLGLSAARHNVPLVLVGPAMPAWKWYEGGATRKVPGTLRALQVLNEVIPKAAVALVDSSDLLIANEFLPVHEATMGSLGAHDVMVGGECNSWPVCYRKAYKAHAEHQRCMSQHSACYPNFGVQAARSPGALARYLRALLTMLDATRSLPTPAEQGYDQAALHRLYLRQAGPTAPSGSSGGGGNGEGEGGGAMGVRNGTRVSHAGHRAALEGDVRLRVDGASALVLQLWSCGDDGPVTRSRGGQGGWEYCSEGRHEPLERLSTTVSASGRSLCYNGTDGQRRHPWLLHANGKHSHLKAPQLRSLLEPYEALSQRPWAGAVGMPRVPGVPAARIELRHSAAAAVAAAAANGAPLRHLPRGLSRTARLAPPGPPLEAHVRSYPVLVIESYSQGACFVTTLGRLLNRSTS